MALHIVLVEPEIPPNTGNIARTCAATDTALHLVKPLGFSIDEKAVKRAGLDYWPFVKLEVHESLDDFMEKYGDHNLYLATTKGGQGCSISFNPVYFSNFVDLNNEYNRTVKSHFHVANSNVFANGSHEVGHAIESMIIDKLGYSDELAIETFGSSEIAAGIVSEAYRALPNPDKKVNEIGKISRYALNNESETLAEAIVDYFTNAEKAADLTLEIIKAIKRTLKEVS